VQLNGSSGDEIKLTQTLVVDKPNGRKDSRDFRVTCK
jgi:hypothetical protein